MAMVFFFNLDVSYRYVFVCQWMDLICGCIP
jgi:hypothetical protein